MSAAAKLISEANAVDRELHGAKPAAAPGGPDEANNAEFNPMFDPAAEWAFIPKTCGSVLALAMPELGEVYSDKACLEWGRAMHAVAQKRGWNAASMGPEMALAAATASLVLPTFFALQQRKARAKERDVTPAGENPAPDDGGSHADDGRPAD